MARFHFSRSILENPAVLYVFFVFALISLVYFAGTGDIATTAIFVCTGFVAAVFNKNMIVVLVAALVVSHIYKYGVNKMRAYREGLDGDGAAASPSTSIDYGQLKDTPLFDGTKLDITDMTNKLKIQQDILNDLAPKVKELQLKQDTRDASGTVPATATTTETATT